MERRNLLFITLMLPNSIINMMLPLFLIGLMPELHAVFVSVLAVFVFCEIIPQSVCTGAGQLRIASRLCVVLRVLMIIESPAAYPISKVLDWLVAERKKERYQNDELRSLIEVLRQNPESDSGGEDEGEDSRQEDLTARLIKGAIDLRSVCASKVMKDYEEVFAVNVSEVMTEHFIRKLKEQGYSRCPVYKGDKHHVIGILLVKRLIGINQFDKTLKDLKIELRRPLVVSPDKRLIELLVEFRKGKSHMALVTNQKAKLQSYFVPESEERKSVSTAPAVDDPSDSTPVTILGIVTLEDVVEKALGSEILDEEDYDQKHFAYMQHDVSFGRWSTPAPPQPSPTNGGNAAGGLKHEVSHKDLTESFISKHGSDL